MDRLGVKDYREAVDRLITDPRRDRTSWFSARRIRRSESLTSKGLRITGASPDGRLAEIVELKDHPWFLGCQFHPEFKSRPTNPHPLFSRFIEASLKQRSEAC